MLILEAIFTFLRRSLGSMLRALFGWATLALFGEVREKERPFLTLVVAAAAVWPFLLVGTIFPRQAALLLAIVPVPKGTPESIVRGIWIVLTVAIPFGVGWALSRRTRAPEERGWGKALLLGIPTTLGLGLGFLFVCVAVPVRKLAALFSGKKEEHVALAMAPEDYSSTVAQLREALLAGGVPIESRPAPWGTRALGKLLHIFAGAILRSYQPENLEFSASPEIQLTFYPNGVRLYGGETVTARAHALLVECATGTPALLTMSPEGQKLEKRIKALWARRRDAHPELDRDVQELARELADTSLGFRDWETLYRELLQLVVASRGASRLIQRTLEKDEEKAGRRRRPRRRLRNAIHSARGRGGKRLREIAADRSLKLIERLAYRMLAIFARR